MESYIYYTAQLSTFYSIFILLRIYRCLSYILLSKVKHIKASLQSCQRFLEVASRALNLVQTKCNV